MTTTYLKRYWQLYALISLPIIYFLIFRYGPMYGVQIAFKDFNLFQGISGSEWIGFDAFREVFGMRDFYTTLRNTFMLNFLDLVVSFPAPIILAIMLYEVRFKWFKKISQTILYIPHFISWVIIGGIVYQLFGNQSGMVNGVLESMGLNSIPFLTEKNPWLVTYLFTGVWQSAGWGTILYLAALTGVNKELFEAAEIDGASRLKRIWHITLPSIKPTIVTLLILNLGHMVSIGFDRPYIIGNTAVREYSDVLSTFVYRVGLESGQYTLATVVGLFQAVVGLIFVLGSNYISKKATGEGIL
ncbi:ABC transporter permease subunit [Paenibacillus sp. FSL H7-0942]|uniref:Aldouronate transport system permease protein n=2 Tax=Paenibacillus TaxID=44249 RepID=A0ABS4RXC2_PAEXY|nr:MULTISPECIES: ABC transporter permease subunit [Paenibacillus]ETT29695.1 binding-protein-dependent transport systems inner membrane component [Paenibacillus sp. FSL R5-192]ETT43024.1 binding-protein-dependent transport systems inner membrane component [Paenibacillus sp. FSL H7-689]KLU56863.1 sugar ABC transporter ATPase [Paenibacillus sp. VT-400]MBP2247399.1 putative aldouronate transport system permease protein [Paenibacillus xylanexedens]MCF7758304.1 ABC transporter permease subunit [Paen